MDLLGPGDAQPAVNYLWVSGWVLPEEVQAPLPSVDGVVLLTDDL